jgi:general stress protein CsbA
MSAKAGAPVRARRLRFGLDGLTFDGANMDLTLLLLLLGAALYAVFANSRWWVFLAVLALIPGYMVVSWFQRRLSAETAAKQQAVLLDRIDSAGSPSVELSRVIRADLERAGLDVGQGGTLNSFVVETSTKKLLVEVVGSAPEETR